MAKHPDFIRVVCRKNKSYYSWCGHNSYDLGFW